MSYKNDRRHLVGLGCVLLLIAGCSLTLAPSAGVTTERPTPTAQTTAFAAASARSSVKAAALTTTPTTTSPTIATPSVAIETAVSSQTTSQPITSPASLSAKIDIGGYKLQIRCLGEGSPTVIFDSGLGASGLAWVNSPGKTSPWQEVSTTTRACIYDRAGLGDSERGPSPRDSEQIVKELHALLTNAKISPPYVLVGHSFGGHNIRLYTSHYPDEVTGMVLVDVNHEDAAERYRTALAMNEKERVRDIIINLGANVEGVNFEASDAQVKAARTAVPFPSIPLIVLSAGKLVLPPGTSEDQRRTVLELQQELHQDLARLSPYGKLVAVEQSGHSIQQDQPDIVINAVREVVEAARQSGADSGSSSSAQPPSPATAQAAPNTLVTPSPTAPSVWPTPPANDYQQLLRLFDYDPQSPLDIEETLAHDITGVRVGDISYVSPKGGRVPAYLVTPPGSGPFAAIIMMHGQPGTRADLLEHAVYVARTGAVVLLIDAPWNRRGGEPVTFTPQDREEQIQLIVDLRRGVDLLAARADVDAERIGYFGVSYGAAMGGLLAGVEDRIKAYVLAVGDGGLVEHFTDEHGPVGPLQKVPQDQQKQWIAAMQPIEPLHFVGHAAPAAIFFQSAQRDEQVRKEDATRFHAAASEPKRIEWYNASHRLNEDAIRDQVAWLAEQIGIDADKFTPFEP